MSCLYRVETKFLFPFFSSNKHKDPKTLIFAKKVDRKFETVKGRLLRNIPIVVQNVHKSETSCLHRKGKRKFRINPTCHAERRRKR